MKTFIAILLVSLFLSSNLLASEKKIAPLSIKTSLMFFGDEELKGEVTSYLSRELRSLGDVTLVNDNFKYLIIIWAYSIDSNVAISFTISKRFNPKSLNNLIDLFCPKSEESMKKFAKDLTASLDLRDNGLAVGPIEHLKRLCQKIIVSIDTSVFESDRKMHRVMQKMRLKNNK